MKKIYTIPVLLEGNGKISLTVSQAAALGIVDAAKWEDWWDEFGDIIPDFFPGFDPEDSTTWEDAISAGFDPGDPDSWYILIGM